MPEPATATKKNRLAWAPQPVSARFMRPIAPQRRQPR